MGNKNCIFTIDFNGQKIEFKSDKDLDSFLLEHQNEFKLVGKTHKTLSTDLQAITEQILKEIKLDISNAQTEVVRINDDPEETEVFKYVKNSIGVSTFITTYGNPSNWNTPISTPFNKEAWREKKLKEYLDQNISKDEAKKLVKNEEDSWEYLTNIGTEIHHVIESVFNNEEDKIDVVLLNDFPDIKNLIINAKIKNVKELLELANKNNLIASQIVQEINLYYVAVTRARYSVKIKKLSEEEDE